MSELMSDDADETAILISATVIFNRLLHRLRADRRIVDVENGFM